MSYERAYWGLPGMPQSYHRYDAVMVSFSLRLPDDLHAQIKAAAEASRRSIHAEILWRLERSLDEDRERS